MLLIEGEDPDPLPSAENDASYGSYDGLRAHETVWAQEEYEQEKQCNDVARLTTVANELLSSRDEVQGDELDKRLVVNGSILRRRLVGERHVYFFSTAMKSGIYEYTRTWTTESESVQYPLDSEYYESASRVLDRLTDVFGHDNDSADRSLGARVLAKVLRVVRESLV